MDALLQGMHLNGASIIGAPVLAYVTVCVWNGVLRRRQR